MKKALRDKLGLVFTSLYSRMTDFQLQSEDEEYFNKIEELRGRLTQIEGELLCIQQQKNVKAKHVEKQNL